MKKLLLILIISIFGISLSFADKNPTALEKKYAAQLADLIVENDKLKREIAELKSIIESHSKNVGDSTQSINDGNTLENSKTIINSTVTTTQSSSSSSGSTPIYTGGKNIKTGPRGGTYYINKNGNKTYVKKK